VQNIGERAVLAKLPNLPAVRLTQRRYFDDAEVRDRAPAKGASWVAPLGPDRDGGRLTPPPPLELPAPAPVEAQAAQPEHEHAGDNPAGDTGAASTAGSTAGNAAREGPAVNAAWYGGLPTGDGPDVDR